MYKLNYIFKHLVPLSSVEHNESIENILFHESFQLMKFKISK